MKKLARFFVVICTFGANALLAQTQLGNDIDGEASRNYFGYSASLSADGNRLAVGGRGNDDNGENSGHVRVFQWSGTSWNQLGADIDGEAAGDSFGSRVSLSSDGNRLAIGASKNDGNGEDSGHVRVFQWSGEAWMQLGADIDGVGYRDESGARVSLSPDGEIVAIASLWNDSTGGNSGHVRVYQWSGEAWILRGSDIDGEGFEGQFGRSVSLSSDGSLLAIGAPYYDDNGLESGHVQVYQWSGTAWTPFGTGINGEEASDVCGRSVSLSSDGNRMAIGCPAQSSSERNSGRVRVFQWSDSAWTPLGAEIVGEAVGDQFGERTSLSQDGNRLAIGTPRNDGNGEDSGHVRVFQWSGEAWTQLGVDIDGEAIGDWSGAATALSPNGNRVAIGAELNDGNGDKSGHVRVYDLSMFNIFKINAGLNDAWYNKVTDGQGFLITVLPESRQVFVAWFTFDTERPPEDVTAHLGEPGHRWLIASGPYSGDTANLTIYVSKGGVFDAPDPPAETDLAGDGTLVLEFADCVNALVTYDITSLGISGEIPIERIAPDNVSLCESLQAE